MIRALLDTNIIIHRENTDATNYSIGQLFYWLDKLHYEKIIHPLSIEELRKSNDNVQQRIYDARLDAYTQMKSVAQQTDEFKKLLLDTPKTENDKVDNQLLFEVFSGRVDILITEDRRMRNKANNLGISNKVFSINSFIGKASAENPELIDYKVLGVKKTTFGEVDLNNSFFDSFRCDYNQFDNWFLGKSNEDAYICLNDKGEILGFLYLKTELENENYYDIIPVFSPKKRLKVGTFKVEATGFRLGERFLKIVFDNAIERQVEEIYLTMYKDRPELKTLYNLLCRWGFQEYGIKNSNEVKQETVLVKKLGCYDSKKNVIYNYPNLMSNSSKFFLPIKEEYHTPLFPDSKLNTEISCNSSDPYRYALQKVYISWAFSSMPLPGDIVVFYLMSTKDPKKYHSVITTIGVIDEVITDFNDKEDFFSHCQNRSVFSKDDLEFFWKNKRNSLKVIKFVYVKSLSKKLNLDWLWNHGIVTCGNGPRSFDSITNEQFKLILDESETKLFM